MDQHTALLQMSVLRCQVTCLHAHMHVYLWNIYGFLYIISNDQLRVTLVEIPWRRLIQMCLNLSDTSMSEKMFVVEEKDVEANKLSA